MNQKEFASTVLGVSPAVFSQVLNGQRNFGNENAEKASVALATDKDIWRNPKMSENRILAWNKFCGKEKKSENLSSSQQ